MTVKIQELNLDCQKCPENKRKAHGCIEPTKEPFMEIEGEPIDRCPLKLITEQSINYINFYSYYTEGYLPNAGGILDQPGKFMDAITVIENILGEMRQEKEKGPRNKS